MIQNATAGMSTGKGAAPRALAAALEHGLLSFEAFARMIDDEIEAAPTKVPGMGPWRAHGFLVLGAPLAGVNLIRLSVK